MLKGIAMEFLNFLYDVLFPENTGEVSQAIAPLLIAAAAAAPAIGAAIGSAYSGYKQGKKADELSKELEALDKPQFGASGAAEKLAAQAYDPRLLEQQTSFLQSGIGTGMSLAARGGGNIADILRAGTQSKLSQDSAAAQMQFQAQANLGQQQFAAGNQQNQYLIGKENALMNQQFAMEQGQVQAYANAISGLGQAVGAGLGGYAQGQMTNQMSQLQNLGIQAQLAQQSGDTEQYNAILDALKKITGGAENGKIQARVKMTPGQFSHEKNPIDIMKDGKKIGEMTGGEGIVPPDLMKKIKMLISKGANEELAEMLDVILAKWEAEADIDEKVQEKKESLEEAGDE